MQEEEFEFQDYTFEGMLELAKCIKHWRTSPHPSWESPHATAYEQKKRKEGWSLNRMADIINERHPGLARPVNKDIIDRLEKPDTQTREPSHRLLELIAGLKICPNLRTGEPFTAGEFRDMAKGLIDWEGFPIRKTGRRKNRVA